MHLDLTLIAGAKEYVEAQPSRTELFRSPLVSFLYERGWRQNFNLTGFLVPKRRFFIIIYLIVIYKIDNFDLFTFEWDDSGYVYISNGSNEQNRKVFINGNASKHV
ncbi:hypothetical protein HanHA300_Chr12g0461991 [Helianthus annuus]|nr:hypothetical protein HanHA300_Chr12g0461991 [Helianthus annuus]KAJ0506912.1 hypothetical protein HanHA89_Chr12g0487411 [Helianthus annuus]KAJ0676548.1 hypothetical protein HanLR1_Chr12g0464011 [Helianthus annuus]